jgi:hypothetical protein
MIRISVIRNLLWIWQQKEAATLKQADQMPETDNGGLGQQIPEYVFLQPAIPGQMGPIAIPYVQSHSDSKVLVTGRITAVVPDPQYPDNIIYVGTAQGGIWIFITDSALHSRDFVLDS